MHKKDRPTLKVTSLLYGLSTPNNFNNNHNNNINNNNNSINPITSPNGGFNGNGLTITGNGTSTGNITSSTGTLNVHNSLMPNTNTSPIDGNVTVTSCDNNNRYPANHPLSGSKHLCAICEDRASGKHYGVYSCEGCKGFFKRTVRKSLHYACRDVQNCIVDKRQRNRCQFCRYKKCLEMGMKREAVQEERQRNKPENEPESSTGSATITSDLNELNIERLTEAEKLVQINPNKYQFNTKIATNEIELLFLWIKHIPYFNILHNEDQLTLLKNGWNELLIAEFSYRSTCKEDAILLANGVEVSKQNAKVNGIGDIFGRVLNDLVAKMREMEMDYAELGCLRAIVLFNPAIKNLKNSTLVEKLRDKVYSILENHCRMFYQDRINRFGKLLVRLPALRSIGLKCVEHLFFPLFQQENNNPEQSIENFIYSKIKN